MQKGSFFSQNQTQVQTTPSLSLSPWCEIGGKTSQACN